MEEQRIPVERPVFDTGEARSACLVGSTPIVSARASRRTSACTSLAGDFSMPRQPCGVALRRRLIAGNAEVPQGWAGFVGYGSVGTMIDALEQQPVSGQGLSRATLFSSAPRSRLADRLVSAVRDDRQPARAHRLPGATFGPPHAAPRASSRRRGDDRETGLKPHNRAPDRNTTLNLKGVP